MKFGKSGLKLPLLYGFRKSAVRYANFPIAMRERRKIVAFVTYDQHPALSGGQGRTLGGKRCIQPSCWRKDIAQRLLWHKSGAV
jgi:hypothetical protein